MNGIADLYKLADVEPGKPSPMMVFPVGDWTSAKYPKLSLSQELAHEVIANFESEVLRTRVPVDLNHDPTSPANGWVDRLYMAPFEWQGVSGEALFADWTPNERGAQLVNDGEYAYDSLEIATHEDPVTHAVTDNVLKAISLTNRPVLRMMPGVADAGDSIKLAEPVEIALSEITLAAIPDFIRSKMRAKWRKQNPGKDDAEMPDNMKEDPDATKASDSASSEPASHDAKGDEGQPMTLADGSAEPKEGDHMKTVALKLHLSEDSDEATILAEVVKLAEDRDAEKGRADAAEATLADEAKRIRSEAVERTLGELIEGGHITPGQKGEMLLLAEDSPAGFDRACVILKTSQAIVLGEAGSGKAGDGSEYADASVELAERSRARAAKDGTTYAEAMRLTLAEDIPLAKRYDAFRSGKEA